MFSYAELKWLARSARSSWRSGDDDDEARSYLVHGHGCSVVVSLIVGVGDGAGAQCS